MSEEESRLIVKNSRDTLYPEKTLPGAVLVRIKPFLCPKFELSDHR